MNPAANTIRTVRLAAVAAVCAGLAACGGGGGDDKDDDRGTVVLTTANRDVAAHAIAGGAIGLGGADAALPTAASLAARGRAYALSARPAAVLDGEPVPCMVSGTATETDDDRDNSGTPTAGDVITIVFDQCRDSADELIDGKVAMTLVSVESTSVVMRMTSTALVTDRGPVTDPPEAHHRTRIDGTMLAESRQLDASTIRTTLTAQGAVQMTLHAPTFDDTVELLDGFVQRIDENMSTGLSRAAQSGLLSSQAAGGTLALSTPTAFVIANDEEFPRSGVLRALGRSGELRLTAVSTQTVQLDLDANEDGTFEDTDQQPWDWLI